MGKIKDLTGQKFGRLRVIKYLYKNKDRQACWLCQCECGNQTIVKGHSLLSQHTKSCGCLGKETQFQRKYKNLQYSKLQKKIDTVWRNMISRCYDPKNKTYNYYGERNVSVCEEWKENFETFYEWAINNGYKEGLTLDRIDSNGNYEPSNCRWVNMKTQNRNSSHNHLITYNGETHCLTEWAEIKKVLPDKIRMRLKRNWSIEKALNTP